MKREREQKSLASESLIAMDFKPFRAKFFSGTAPQGTWPPTHSTAAMQQIEPYTTFLIFPTTT